MTCTRLVYSRVKAQLMGTEEIKQESKKAVASKESNRVDQILDSLSSWNWRG